MKFLQPLLGDMGINLRRRQIRMPEKHLHRAKISAVVEKVRSKGVAQGVRREVTTDVRHQAVSLDHMPAGLPRHRPGPPGNE